MMGNPANDDAERRDDGDGDDESPSASRGYDAYKHGEGDQDNDDDTDDVDGPLIDSFLRGEYDYEIPDRDGAPLSPHPGLAPAGVVRECLRSLRNLHVPTPSHGAAVLQRFLLPLSRRERWGTFAASVSAASRGGGTFSSSTIGDNNDDDNDNDTWRTHIMRPALTPHLLARQIRASSAFGCLLDWTDLVVTDAGGGDDRQPDWVGGGGSTATATTTTATTTEIPSVAHVDAVLRFDEDENNSNNNTSNSRMKKKKKITADDEDMCGPVRFRFKLRRIGGVWLIDSARRMAFADEDEEAPPFD